MELNEKQTKKKMNSLMFSLNKNDSEETYIIADEK